VSHDLLNGFLGSLSERERWTMPGSRKNLKPRFAEMLENAAKSNQSSAYFVSHLLPLLCFLQIEFRA